METNEHKRERIRVTIQPLLLKRSADPAMLTDDFDYVAAGLVDSLSLLRFVLELESTLQVNISNEDILDPRFRTVGGLIDILETKL